MGVFAGRARARRITTVFRAPLALAAFLLAAVVILLGPQALMAGEPDDISAYQAQYGSPPPFGAYPGAPAYARRDLMEHLNYAEAQYAQARRAGDREAARHWRKEIKRLRRELGGQAKTGRAIPPWGPPAQSPYPPVPGPGYSGYAAPYVPAPYQAQIPPGVAPYGQPLPQPPGGYASGPAAPPFGPSAASGSGGLGALLGPLLGGASAAQPSTAYPGYRAGSYPPPGGASPNGATGAPSMGGIGSLLGPLLGTGSAP